MSEDRKSESKENESETSKLQAWSSPSSTENAPGATEKLTIKRNFSDPAVHPFDQIEWEKREAKIADDDGTVIFEQKDIEVPAFWSQLATKVVVSKYFYGDASAGERESSVKQLIHRVSRTIADWGKADG
jgi:ribonucleoside-diphosphate reductase alpha chain